jgi:hypothetical protein
MKRSTVLAAVTVALASVVTLLAAEGLLRLALFSDAFAVEALRQPWRYADSFLDEDYWKLASRFRTVEGALRAGRTHPTLGWSPDLTPDNPLGEYADQPRAPANLVRPVLVYGDSFIAGATPMSSKIPQLLEARAGGRPFVNLGVSGFGVDQIYLRFAQTVDLYAQPTILFGILMDDLNRSAMRYRMAPKPYFERRGEHVVLRSSPVTLSAEEYLERHPPGIRSYLGRLVLFSLREYLPRPLFENLLGYDETIQEMKALNRLILRQLRDEARRRGLDVYVVLFYGVHELERPSWQEPYVKATLEELGLPYFDTRPPLDAAVASGERTRADLYYAHNNHPNELGNRIIADALFAWLKERGAL